MSRAARVVPNNSVHDVVTFDILSNGQPINSGYQVLSLTVTKEVNRLPTAKIVLRDGDSSEERFEISDTADFIPGNKIQIKIGHDSSNKTVFKGIIVKHAVKIRENGDTSLVVECRDEAVRMTIGRHSKYFVSVKDSDVMTQLIGDHADLSADVETTTIQHAEIVQHHVSDWDFMLLRADANGKIVVVEDGKVSVKKPNTEGSPALSLVYGSSIIEYEAEMDARGQWQNAKARSWDYTTQALFSAESSNGNVHEIGNLTGKTLANSTAPSDFELMHGGKVSTEELQALAASVMQRSRLAKISGRVKCQGTDLAKVGGIVQLDGIGDRFNGNVFVTAVRHEAENGSWYTHIQFGLPSQRFAEMTENIGDAPTAGLVSAVQGLQIGVVVQLENDPEGEDRILVRQPTIDNNAQGIWMRLASLDSGNNRGAFFRPEIGDEVIIGFINDDPRDGVVLGMLHSSAKPAPIRAKDTNHLKGFTTRSNMHLSFDDEKKKISIDTPAANSIVIDESEKTITITDQNNNKITLSSSGIELNSPKDIVIKAGMNLTMSGGQAVNISAPTVSAKADTSIELKGAMAKLSASGIAEISGSLVKIN